VLNAWWRWGYLPPVIATRRHSRRSSDHPDSDDNVARGPEGLIRAQVLRELRNAGSATGSEYRRVADISTIDARAQQSALGAVHDRLDPQRPSCAARWCRSTRAPARCAHYYGGNDGVGFDFAQAPLQTGSAFKVFAVIAALQQSIPLSRVIDSSPVTDRGAKITNVDGESCGKCTMAEALKRSLNTSSTG